MDGFVWFLAGFWSLFSHIPTCQLDYVLWGKAKDLNIDRSIVYVLLRYKYNRSGFPVSDSGAQFCLVVSHRCMFQYKMIPTFRYLNGSFGYYSDSILLGKITLIFLVSVHSPSKKKKIEYWYLLFITWKILFNPSKKIQTQTIKINWPIYPSYWCILDH